MKTPERMLDEGGVDVSIADVICMRFPEIYNKGNWAIIRRMVAFELQEWLRLDDYELPEV